jgi:hypothetical protein
LVEASFDFELIADPIGIGVIQAHSVTVISCIWEDTVYKVCDEAWIDVITGFGVDATFDFELVADSIVIVIGEALSLAVVSILSKEARSVFIGRFCVVVACCCVRTSRDFKWVAYSVTVCIYEALTFAVVSILSKEARSVIVGGFSAVVAGGFIGAPFDFELVADSISIGISKALAFAVVSGFRELAHFGSTGGDTSFFDIEQCSHFVCWRSVDECLNVQRS